MRFTYANAVAMMSAATINENIIPALTKRLRLRDSFACCLASRRSRRARRMGRVEGMGELYRLVLSLSKGGRRRKDERGKMVESRKWRALLKRMLSLDQVSQPFHQPA